MEAKKKLNKNLSQINVWSLALGSIIGWGAFVMPGNLFLSTAGTLGTAIGMLIGAFIMIIVSMSYGYLVQKFPVAGGGFAFTFKGFGRTHAFICAWFLGLSYVAVVPLNATALGLIGRYLFPGVLQKGYLYSVAGWDVYFGEVLITSIALLIFAIASIKGSKISGKIQTLMTFMLVGSIVFLTFFALISDKTSFSNLKPFFSEGNTPINGILSIVAIAPWAYLGFDSIPQSAEEFNFSPKKAKLIMIGSILLGSLLYIAMNIVTAVVFPWDEFISSKPFWATGTAVKYLMGRGGLFILGIALISAISAGIIGFYMASSRLLLSIARARALPHWFSFVHPIYKTPSNSIKFVLFISLITPWFGRQVLIWIVDMTSIGAAIGFFYTTASAFILSRKEKDKKRQTIFSFMGIILSLSFVFLLIFPGSPTYLSVPARVALLIWIALGVIFYFSSSKDYNEMCSKELCKIIFNEH